MPAGALVPRRNSVGSLSNGADHGARPWDAWLLGIHAYAGTCAHTGEITV